MIESVSFELAKLLKEKGYDRQTINIYLDGVLLSLKAAISNSQFMTSRSYTAPTISEVILWLYEVHNIWITAEPFTKSDNSVVYIYKIFKGSVVDTISRVSNGFRSLPRAYEAAIEYTLLNLI